MALLLSIETSSHFFSCALHLDGKLVAFEESIQSQTAASQLARSIDSLFESTEFSKQNLNSVVVASGPGSYTGLRIGVATAKGICYALSIPLVAIETLYLMTEQVILSQNFENSALLCPMLDARRNEVYCTLYDLNLKVVMPTEAKVIDDKSFEETLNHRAIYFFGEGSDKCRSLISHSNARFISGITPSAKALGELGYRNFLKNACVDIEHFEPFYLKDFIPKKAKSFF
jgi:tRNA threonylcarbamoyladenosine biosynthesis protein TsaB